MWFLKANTAAFSLALVKVPNAPKLIKLLYKKTWQTSYGPNCHKTITFTVLHQSEMTRHLQSA